MSRYTSFVITRLEATVLTDLVTQFAELVAGSDDGDPAVDRLTPDVYPDDPAASAQFRDVARSDLLGRRASDAETVLGALRTAAEAMPAGDEPGEDDVIELMLDAESVKAWLRTLASIRLVLASRLGITDDTPSGSDDPRFGVYDWVGYRLEGLVQASEPDDQGIANT